MVRKSRKMGWAGHVMHLEDILYSYVILVGKIECIRTHGRSQSTTNVHETGLKHVDCIILDQGTCQWSTEVNTEFP
jgi:hypothetical protein